MDAKLEHLKLIQTAVTRMATNSFMLKGWTVTLVAALFAFAAKDSDRGFIVIAWLPLLIFGCLDGYYLYLERLFRARYQHVSELAEPDTKFSMDISGYRQSIRPWHSASSPSIWGFYAPIALLLLVMTIYVALYPHAAPTPIQGPKTVTISIQ